MSWGGEKKGILAWGDNEGRVPYFGLKRKKKKI